MSTLLAAGGATAAMAAEYVKVEGWAEPGRGRQIQLRGADGSPVGWYDLSRVDPNLVSGRRRLDPERLIVELPGIGWIASTDLKVRFCDHVAPGQVNHPNRDGPRTATQMGSGAACAP